MKSFFFKAAGGLVAVALISTGRAETFQSGEGQVTLVELFTSEGCSSCPPADARLAHFREDPGLWKDVVPVAFHVDYWDNLGWPDRYAAPEFTERQRAYAAHWRAQSVYTPEFVLNGRDGGSGGRPATPGSLRAEVSSGGEVTVTFAPTKPVKGSLVAEVAPLASGITSDVRRGENAGRRLPHEFVALALASAPLSLSEGGWTATLKLPGQTVAPISAAAVWVHAEGDPTPIQATGGWLKKGEN